MKRYALRDDQYAAKKSREIVDLIDSDVSLILKNRDQMRQDYSIKIESCNKKALENYQRAIAEGNKEASATLDQLKKDLGISE